MALPLSSKVNYRTNIYQPNTYCISQFLKPFFQEPLLDVVVVCVGLHQFMWVVGSERDHEN